MPGRSSTELNLVLLGLNMQARDLARYKQSKAIGQIIPKHLVILSFNFLTHCIDDRVVVALLSLAS